MSNPPRRRWFQFGLRTVFVVVTAFAVCLGWELSIVRERQAVKQWIESNGGECWTLQEFAKFPGQLSDETVPPWRRWMGDDSVFVVQVPKKFTSDECDRIKRAIREIPHDYPLAQRRSWMAGSPIDEKEYRSKLVQ
ncbi:MAG TPA: hypothetical protein VGJ26_21265 [Pirellulales bacterium]|jgi:hypothetical protein